MGTRRFSRRVQELVVSLFCESCRIRLGSPPRVTPSCQFLVAHVPTLESDSYWVVPSRLQAVSLPVDWEGATCCCF